MQVTFAPDKLIVIALLNLNQQREGARATATQHQNVWCADLDPV